MTAMQKRGAGLDRSIPWYQAMGNAALYKQLSPTMINALKATYPTAT